MRDIILVFFGMTVMDFIWGCCVVSMAKQHAMGASVYSSVLCLIGGVVTISFVNDPMLLIPATIGAFIGTFAASKWMSWNARKD